MVCAGVVACSLLATVVLSGVGPIRAIPLISKEELETKLEAVRGDDMRLMRWDATSHTKKQQKGDGCSVLSQALDVIQHSSDTRMQALACEYATFCVTDNPDNRARLSEHTADNTIHKAIVNVIKSADSHASAMASHLVYIATFANLVNHKGFFRANAVAVLSDVIKAYDPAKSESSPKPDQTMWAAAALQNLAASYCETEGDGRCYWTWAWQDHPNVADDSLPVFSEGSSVRRTAMKDEELYEKLGSLVCQGPVKGEMSDENPFPGDNAVIGKHDSSPNIVAWAAAGALKNLALEPEAAPMIKKYMKCFCHISKSNDWLEENKGQGVIKHVRRSNPCWFKDDATGELCIDDEFFDEEEYTCADYGEATTEECKSKDFTRGVLANQACCGCGGGRREGAAAEPEL